jgi:hypothetical protein
MQHSTKINEGIAEFQIAMWMTLLDWESAEMLDKV